MPDRHHPADSPIGRIGPDEPLDAAPAALESRLDALGRSLLEAESRRADPPAAYLEAAADRAALARFRIWAPRLAAAAVLIIAGTAAIIMSSGPIGGPSPGPSEIAGNSETGGEAPTMANLTTANRAVTSPDQLRLLGAGASSRTTSGSTSNTEPYRASDTRRPDKIDAIIGDK